MLIQVGKRQKRERMWLEIFQRGKVQIKVSEGKTHKTKLPLSSLPVYVFLWLQTLRWNNPLWTFFSKDKNLVDFFVTACLFIYISFNELSPLL